MTTIRPALATDHEAISGIVREAFGQEEEVELVAALRRAGDAAIELVAEEEGRPVGHILLSPLRSPVGCLALAPVSVAPDRQKCGIGSALIRAALAEAAEAAWKAVFVLGDPGYYGRFGFDVGAANRFETAYPKTFFMVGAIKPGILDALPAPVIYAPAFADVE